MEAVWPAAEGATAVHGRVCERCGGWGRGVRSVVEGGQWCGVRSAAVVTLAEIVEISDKPDLPMATVDVDDEDTSTSFLRVLACQRG